MHCSSQVSWVAKYVGNEYLVPFTAFSSNADRIHEQFVPILRALRTADITTDQKLVRYIVDLDRQTSSVIADICTSVFCRRHYVVVVADTKNRMHISSSAQTPLMLTTACGSAIRPSAILTLRTPWIHSCQINLLAVEITTLARTHVTYCFFVYCVFFSFHRQFYTELLQIKILIVSLVICST